MKTIKILLILFFLAIAIIALTPQSLLSVSAQEVTPTVTDTVTPTTTLSAALTINNGASTFIDPIMNLTISSSTDSATLKSMRFSQDNGTSWTDKEPFSISKQLALPQDAVWGDRNVTVEVQDLNDNLATASATTTYISAQKASMQLKTNYSFVSKLNYPNATIDTVETVNFTNTSGDWLSTLNFSVPPHEFGEFILRYVKVDGQEVPTSWSNNSNLVVDLGKNLKNNDSLPIQISFLDTAHSTLTELDSRLSQANGVMEVSQWFPIISNGHSTRDPSDSQFTLLSDFHMELTLNKAMPVAAPGTVSTNGNIVTVDFGSARDFAFSVCPSCKRKTGTTSTKGAKGLINVTVYYTGADSDGATARDNAISSLDLFNNKFNTPNTNFGLYPYKNFVVAQSTKFTDEYPGIIFVGASKLTALDWVRHETAHQWFYGLLGNDQINDPWLDEAFAEWAGRTFGPRNYDSDLPVSRNANDFPDKSLWSNLGAHNSYFQTIYAKGATFIDGVRTKMGDANFWSSMRDLFANNSSGVITTSDVAENWLSHTQAGNKRDALRAYMKYNPDTKKGFISW